jgi:hypothetical protein
MALLTANGEGVTEGMLSLVSSGRSVAEVYLGSHVGESSIQVGQLVDLNWQDGTTDRMFCTRAGPDQGRWRILLLGGKGGLSSSVRPKFYAGIAASSVVSDLLSEVGESPGTISVPGAVQQYVRQAGPGYEALETFLTLFPALSWRVGRDGLTNVGPLAWPDDTRSIDIVSQSPGEGILTLRNTPGLDAGVTLPGFGKADRVVHMVGTTLRTEVYIK